jgi:hypothetical protein
VSIEQLIPILQTKTTQGLIKWADAPSDRFVAGFRSGTVVIGPEGLHVRDANGNQVGRAYTTTQVTSLYDQVRAMKRNADEILEALIEELQE